MTAHSQLTPICHHPCGGSNHLPAWPRHVRRRLHIALLVALAWLAIGSAPLSAQQSEREARGMMGSIAGTIYNLAWPTAEYQDFSLGALQRMDDGWDVPIVLYGKSAFSGGLLWLELVVELRHGSLHDIRLGRNNAVIAPPFATLATTALVVAAVIEQQAQQRQAQLAPGSPAQSPTTPPVGSQRYLTVGDLSGLSSWQLDILRNEIYAWHGRRFQRGDLQAYFDRQPWYRPVYAPEAFPEGLLSSLERYNVELIANHQGNR